MPTQDELKALASLRLQEAETLYNAGQYNGSVYLAGYAVELALKARICKVLGLSEYPDQGKLKPVYAVHDLDQLLLLAGLKPELDSNNPILFHNWSTAVPWYPLWRYAATGTYSQQDAIDMLDAIRDETNGVLQWIMKYW